ARHLPVALGLERGQQAQGQKAMSHGASERALALAAFDVDVNPLVVAGDVGELVDLLLGDLDRLAPRPVGLADFRAQFFDVIEAYGFHRRFSPREEIPLVYTCVSTSS